MNNIANCAKDIITTQSLKTLFQPIISVKKRTAVGIEALTRGIDSQLNLIPPNILFNLAHEEGMTLELDRACRGKALANFKHIANQETYKELLLFLNIDASIIDRGVVGSKHFIHQVNTMDIAPGNIVIEIIESKVNDLRSLSKFVDTHKEYGFLIAMDDIGSGYSNLDRISIIRPDIIKIDRTIISNIHREYHKQEVLKSLINLSKSIGALVVAEGVEEENEALTVMEYGVDMLQGFYFAKPCEYKTPLYNYNQIDGLARKFKLHMTAKIYNDRLIKEQYLNHMEKIILLLSEDTFEDINTTLIKITCEHPAIECIYVLDESGIQVSNTICNYYKLLRKNKVVFTPANRGVDHSLKDYYLFINTGLNLYITDPYISLASGNLCTTVAAKYINVCNNSNYIVCVDYNQELFK